MQDVQPHVTIRTMVRYLTASGAHQRFMVLHNMKSRLGRRRFAPYYQDARSAIRAHHAGAELALDEEIQRLLRARRDATRPADIAKIENNIRVLTEYASRLADEPLEHTGGRFEPLLVNGVRISAEPLLSGKLAVARREISANVIVDMQSEAPSGVEIDYSLELLYRGSGLTRPTPPRGAQFWHATSGDRWYMTSPSARKWRDVQDAAQEIALRWPTIDPG